MKCYEWIWMQGTSLSFFQQHWPGGLGDFMLKADYALQTQGFTKAHLEHAVGRWAKNMYKEYFDHCSIQTLMDLQRLLVLDFTTSLYVWTHD